MTNKLSFFRWVGYAFILIYGYTPIQGQQFIYENPLQSLSDVDEWIMEGPGKLKFEDGWMQMWSPNEEHHHVFWCPIEFPESFIAEWEVQNLKTEAGLCIIFFAYQAEDGSSIFADHVNVRDGTFRQYTRGDVCGYHISYYANAAHNPDRKIANLRKNSGFNLVQEGGFGIPTKSQEIHKLKLKKEKGSIKLWIDERLVINWDDPEYSEDSSGNCHRRGYIGFRQMQWTHFQYRNFKVHSIDP